MRILSRQMEALRLAQDRSLERRLVQRLCRHYPVHRRCFDEAVHHELASAVILTARAHRFVSEEAMNVVMDAMVRLGTGFASDPLCRPLQAVLDDHVHGERQRLRALAATGANFWASFAGDGGADWVEAIGGFRHHSPALEPSLASRYFHARVAMVDPESRRQFAQQSADLMAERGLTEGFAQATLRALQLLFGSGVLDDPRFHWADELLRHPGPDRGALLHEAAAARFDSWLETRHKDAQA